MKSTHSEHDTQSQEISSSERPKRNILSILLPIVVLIAGVSAMRGLIANAPSEDPVVPEPVLMDVETMLASIEPQTIQLQSNGVVQPASQVSLVPQVAGRVIFVLEDLTAGSKVKKGQVLVKIESADFELAVQQEQARVKQAELNLHIEDERVEAAQREWELLGHSGEAPALAAREPQLANAKVSLEAAQAGLKRAELALSRTVIRAPFNGIVQSEQVDIGQVVSAATPMLSLIGSDRFLVRLSVLASQLASIDIPQHTAETGSVVELRYLPGTPEEVIKSGSVLRLEGQLDSQARTATLLVAIDSPLTGEGVPMLPGAYVQATVIGKGIAKGVRIPATALRDGNHVLIADGDDLMARRDVVVGWKASTEVVLLSGLSAGDRIITSPISVPIYGSPLNIVGGKQ